MEIDLPELIVEIDFNYDTDKKEFCENPHGGNKRIIDLCGGINEDSSLRLSLSFPLGRKSDDTVTLTFDAEELLNKIQRAITFGEDARKE